MLFSDAVTPRTSAAVLAGVLLTGGTLVVAEVNGTSTQAVPMHATASTHHLQARIDTGGRITLYKSMRTLWAQHMEWTYSTVVAFVENAGLQHSLNRLLRNQTDIGNAIVPFYGTAAGAQLSQLLHTHIQDAVPVLVAAKAGDTTALNAAVAAWYANARQIADFLAAANPHWSRSEMRDMMHTHITQTIAYATDLLQGHFGEAIQTYDQAETHMLHMSDMLSRGIIAQFPAKIA